MLANVADHPPVPRWSFRDFRLVLLLLIVPFMLRVFPLRRTHSWDEATYLQHAEIFAGTRANYSELNYRPPLLSLIIAAGYTVWHNVAMAHLIVAILTTLGIYFLYRFTAALHDRRIALLAALLYAYAPLPLILGHFILTDAVAFTFMAAAAWLFFRGRRFDGWLAGLLAAAAGLTRFPALSLLLLFAIHGLRSRLPFRYLTQTVTGFALGVLPYLVMSHICWGGWWRPFFSGLGKLSAVGTPWLYLLGLPLVMSTASIGLFFYPRLTRAGMTAATDLTLWLWAAAYAICMACMPLKEIRYLLPATLALFPIAAVGLYDLLRLASDRAWNRALIFFPLAQLAPIALAGVYVLEVPEHMNATSQQVLEVLHDSSEVKTAGVWLKNRYPSDTLVYCSAEYPILAYYSGLPLVKIPGRVASKPQWLVQHMERPGLFVMSRRFMAEDHLPPSFFDKNPAFDRVWESGSYLIYTYLGPEALKSSYGF